MFPLVYHLQNYTAQQSEIDRASAMLRLHFQCTFITFTSRRNYLIFTSRQCAPCRHWCNGSNCVLVRRTELLKSCRITSIFYMFCVTITAWFSGSPQIRVNWLFCFLWQISAQECASLRNCSHVLDSWWRSDDYFLFDLVGGQVYMSRSDLYALAVSGEPVY